MVNKKFTMSDTDLGMEVVRSKGDYVVGRTGLIIKVDAEKKRAQVNWVGNPTTWVSYGSIEPTSDPYEIIKGDFDEKKHRPIWPKYKKK